MIVKRNDRLTGNIWPSYTSLISRVVILEELCRKKTYFLKILYFLKLQTNSAIFPISWFYLSVQNFQQLDKWITLHVGFLLISHFTHFVFVNLRNNILKRGKIPRSLQNQCFWQRPATYVVKCFGTIIINLFLPFPSSNFYFLLLF